MKQKMGRLIRYILIINRLSGLQKYVPSDDLIYYVNNQIAIRGYDVGLTLRTIQRDIKEIEEMFGVVIKNRRGYGYYISESDEDRDIRYKDLLMNFDLLTSISDDRQSAGYIIPEHHRPKGSDQIPTLITAIKESWVIGFSYTLVRKDNKKIFKTVKPYFLKESLGLWYLVCLDEKNELRTFGIDRISNLELTDSKFKRDESIETKNLFMHSYGIWDDPSKPIEEVELSYSPLDGSFLKTTPLHSSQEVLVDSESEFRIRLQIRITNDFIMALLSRSKSLKVIKPESLKHEIRKIYEKALERNQ
ncbi:MAG: WYL domain-containing protein [Muribaculaceae bacterium]|nr:WYL domain-containing protein [Muribaculaceae bacterium]